MRKNLGGISAIAVIFIAVSVLLFSACQKGLNNPGGNPNPPPGNAIDDNITVTGGIRGIVVDENNRPVAGATINSGSNTTTTDRYGVFRFNNINISKANGTVKVSRAGYFTGIRTFVATSGRIHNVRIKLLPKINTGTFNAAAGGTVNLASGGKLVIPTNAVTDATGTAYSGTVNVAMTWIDPTSNELPFIVPGDLRGITTTGEERGLQTFGMLGVELTGTTGQALKIAAGKTAELTFPIPASILSTAPATIDLWNFDETKARWKQEGVATKTGNTYIAQVSHFSFWNCDAPFPLIELCMKIVNASNNEPLNNVQIRIKRPNGSYGYGVTDSAGNLCGKVPQNEVLVLEILSQCNGVVSSQNIGPFSSNSSLGNVAATIPPASSLVISGTLVNCANSNVTNGAAIIYTGNGHSYTVAVTNGAFSLTLLRCDATPINFSVLGVDYGTIQQGNPVTGTGTTGTVNIGSLQACGTSSAEFVELLIDGDPYTYASPPDNISINDSSSIGSGPMSVFAFKTQSGGTNTSYSMFGFQSNGATGVMPLTQCRVSNNTSIAEVIVTPNPTITITVFGPPGTGFIEGNFSVQMNFGTVPKNVVCTFRVRRN